MEAQQKPQDINPNAQYVFYNLTLQVDGKRGIPKYGHSVYGLLADSVSGRNLATCAEDVFRQVRLANNWLSTDSLVAFDKDAVYPPIYSS